MASPIGHGLVGAAAFLLAARPLPRGWRTTAAGLGACVALANLPDADFLLPLLAGDGVGNAFHRGFSHSLAFALLAGAVAALLAAALRALPGLGAGLPGWRRAGLWAGGLVASHLVLDLFTVDTNPPAGLPLLLPFSEAHFLAPVRFFAPVAHDSLAALVAPANLAAMATDLWLAVPLAAAVGLARWRHGAR